MRVRFQSSSSDLPQPLRALASLREKVFLAKTQRFGLGLEMHSKPEKCFYGFSPEVGLWIPAFCFHCIRSKLKTMRLASAGNGLKPIKTADFHLSTFVSGLSCLAEYHLLKVRAKNNG
jgi:hypothetical protein